MRAAVVAADGSVSVRDVPRPRPRAGELLIRVSAVGLCGSDVEKLASGDAAGAVLGHEIVGVVLAGPLAVGERVAVAHRVPCEDCERCASGHETTCAQYLASGLRPGGFAGELVAPAMHVAAVVQVIPASVDDIAATFVEPLGCVLRGADRLVGTRGAVVGCGAVGLLCLRVLRARGCSVAVMDDDPSRLARALDEADAVAASGAELDWAIATAPGAVDGALRLVRPGGTVLVFAATPGPVPVELDLVYRRELQLVGSRSATPATLRRALAEIASGRIAVRDLATDILPLEQFGEGLARYRARTALKVVFQP